MDRLLIHRLEVRIVEHCNLTCQNCSQNSPFMRNLSGNVDAVVADINKLSEVAEIRKMVLIGGEPLLHPELDGLLNALSASNTYTHLAINTNGLSKNLFSETLWRICDEVMISVYPSTTQRYKKISDRLLQLSLKFGTTLRIMPTYKFREILKMTPHPCSKETGKIFSKCEYKLSTLSLFAGHIFKCAPSINALSISTPNLLDGLELHADNSRQALLDFLESKNPLQACSYCFGSSGKVQPHRMMKSSQINHVIQNAE